MKITFLSVLCLCSAMAYAQDNSLLINSGEIIREGVNYHDEKKYDKAINKYKQVHESDTNYYLALYETGLSSVAQKNYARAIEAFKKGIALRSGIKTDFIQQLGNAYSSDKQFDMAIATYRQGLKEYPYYFRFYYEMAAACYTDKRPKEALQYLDTCLRINFAFGRAHNLMGIICQENNYFVPALMSYQMAAYFSYDDNIGLSALLAMENIARGAVTVNKDSIVKLFAADENNFEELDEIIRSKSELDPRYKVKPAVKLNYPDLIKCLHLMNSRMSQYSGAKGWYGDNLVPIYTDWWNNKEFPTIMYRMCLVTQSDEALKAFTKNKTAIIEQYARFYANFLDARHTYQSRIPSIAGTFKHQFIHKNTNLYAMIPVTESYTPDKGYTPRNGEYIYFHRNGNIKSRLYYKDGEESGTTTRYYEEGGVKEVIHIINDGEYDYTMFYANGQPKYKSIIKDGKVADKVVYYYSNGITSRVLSVGEDQSLSGKSYEYYENGQVYKEVDYSKGKVKDGEVFTYFRNGAIETKTTYKNDQYEGAYIQYFEDGKSRITGQYKAGKQYGSWKKFHRNGKLSEEYGYNSSGNLDGPYKSYFESGVLESESSYADGDNNNKTLRYDLDGKLFAEYVESKGKIKKAIYYDKTGKVIYDVDARKNELLLLKYNALGIKTEEGSVLKDFRTGEWKFYSESGALSYTRKYDNSGIANGACEEYFVGGALRAKYQLKSNNYDGYYVGYYSNGTKYNEGYYVDDQKQGLWKEYYPSGTISEESYYLDNELTGVYKSFYPNGKISTLQEYMDGRFYKYTLYDIEGNAISTDTVTTPGRSSLSVGYKNGNPYLNCSYGKGLKDGKQLIYWGNNNLRSESNYRFDQIADAYKTYFTSGKLHTVTYYKYGETDSLYTEYYPEGGIEWTKMYRDGDANGAETYYYKNGKLETKGENQYGKREGWFEYYAPDGHLQYKLLYHLGVEIAYSYQDKSGAFVADKPFTNATGDFECTFSNGNPSVKGSFHNGERHGVYIKYYFNGKKFTESTYKYGYLEGMRTTYHENGKIKSQVNYIMDRKDGVEKQYDELGNLKTETTWSHDYKNGPEITYKDGKAVKTVIYEYDNCYDK